MHETIRLSQRWRRDSMVSPFIVSEVHCGNHCISFRVFTTLLTDGILHFTRNICPSFSWSIQIRLSGSLTLVSSFIFICHSLNPFISFVNFTGTYHFWELYMYLISEEISPAATGICDNATFFYAEILWFICALLCDVVLLILLLFVISTTQEIHYSTLFVSLSVEASVEDVKTWKRKNGSILTQIQGSAGRLITESHTLLTSDWLLLKLFSSVFRIFVSYHSHTPERTQILLVWDRLRQ